MTETKIDMGEWVMRAVLIALGVAILIGGLNYGLYDEAGLVGAGFVPFVAGATMVLAGLAEAFKAFRARSSVSLVDQPDTAHAAGVEVESASLETTESLLDVDGDGTLDIEALQTELELASHEELKNRRAVISEFVVLIITTVMSHIIGLLLALSLMVFILLKIVERKSWVASIVGAVLAFAFGWGVFGQLLSVPLPTGMLGII